MRVTKTQCQDWPILPSISPYRISPGILGSMLTVFQQYLAISKPPTEIAGQVQKRLAEFLATS